MSDKTQIGELPVPTHAMFLSEIADGRTGKIRRASLMSMKRHVQKRRVVILGDDERPLYAPAGDYKDLQGLSSDAIRSLQALPLDAPILLKDMPVNSTRQKEVVKELKEDDLIHTMGGEAQAPEADASWHRIRRPARERSEMRRHDG